METMRCIEGKQLHLRMQIIINYKSKQTSILHRDAIII